ncbi:gamma-glutamyltransferase, partial [Pseudomonas syringae pv. tagetis]
MALADLDEQVPDSAHMNVHAMDILNKAYRMERAVLVTDPDASPWHGSPNPGGAVSVSESDENGVMIS